MFFLTSTVLFLVQFRNRLILTVLPILKFASLSHQECSILLIINDDFGRLTITSLLICSVKINETYLKMYESKEILLDLR